MPRRKRRRLDVSDSEVASSWDEDPQSEQVSDLLVDWAWGKVPAVQVRLHASLKDGATCPEVAELAKLGAYGLSPQHIHRDLTRKFLKDMNTPHPQSLIVAATNPRTAEPCHRRVYMILPHDWFSHLFHHYRDEFWRVFAVPDIKKFWDGAHRLMGRALEIASVLVPRHGVRAQVQRTTSTE